MSPSVLLALSLALSAAAQAPGMEPRPGELLTNRSFEVDANHDGTPDGWGVGRYDEPATVTLDDATAHSGSRSVRIEAAGAGRSGVSCGFGAGAADPAAVYLLSAWVKVEGTSAASLRTSARITSVDAGGNVLKSDYRVCDPGPFDWRHYEWLVKLPAETARFNLVLFHHGDGRAWWDDVSLLKAAAIAPGAPAQDALVADGRPTLRWSGAAGETVVAISSDPAFADDRTRTYQARGPELALPEPLPLGRTYFWRALVVGPQGELSMTVADDGGPARFFAGTWAQRTTVWRTRLDEVRPTLAALRELAERNGMWDPFRRLATAVETGDRLLAAEPADATAALRELDEAWQEMDLFVPWWQRIFLGDEELFAALDLDLPGLAAVKAAAGRQDWPAARTALRDYYRKRQEPSWYARYLTRPAVDPERPEARADQYLTHQMPIHDYAQPTFDLGPEFDWHVFPIIDIEWPTQIHRCFHWSTIARAFWETGNEPYADEIRRQLLDFAEDNPMERWDSERHRWAWSTLNTTIRIYSSWLDAWLQVRSAEAWTPDAQFVMLTELREHGDFLMTHAARQGNWVVAEARGLVELGVMFPEFKESRAWLEEGYRRLQRELAVQVLADGVHVERTPGYHSMTLGCFMEPVRLGLLNHVAVPGVETFIDRLDQMHELYLYGGKPNHRMAQIGDAGPMDLDGMMRRGWEMFRREDMRYVLTNGAEGQPPVHRSYAFGAAGFYVSRSAWCDPDALWSILDWGGFLGHCHEDMGQICLNAYGSDLLIDSGRFAYAWPLRAYFYQTVGHNTVMVDQTTQKRRDPLAARWVSNDQFDLFQGLTDNSEPLLHQRTFAFRQPDELGPGYWLVVDRLTGEGKHRLDQRWHAYDKLAGKVEGSSVVLSARDAGAATPSLVLAGLAQPGLKTAIDQGWVSYEWYKKQPVDVAQFTLETELPAGFVTVLYPTPPGVPSAEVELTALPATLDGKPASAAEVTAVQVTVRDRGNATTDVWVVRHAEAGEVTVSGFAAGGRSLTTDARAAFLRLNSAWPNQGQWFIADGRRAELVGAEVLLDAGEPVESAGAAWRDGSGRVAGSGQAARVYAGAVRALTVNGAAATPGGEGLQQVDLTPRPIPPVPREAGPVRFEIEPPPPPMQGTTTLRLLPKEAVPVVDVRVEAESFSGQGGGEVELTDTKVGAVGRAFLHWDNAGHWLEWSLPVPAAGDYLVLLRACTAEPRALRKLTVNGETPADTAAMELAGTGGYSSSRDDWRIFVVTQANGEPLRWRLPAGTTSIRLENVDGVSLNLDWLGLARDVG